MKKLVSVLVALALCLCTLAPVMAETTVEAFPYTLETYRMYFDLLATSMFEVAPVWTTSADGTAATATVNGYGVVEMDINAAGQVTCFTTSLVANQNNASTVSNAFGQLIALLALSSKTAEDITFLTEENINQFTNELLGLLNELLGRMEEALGDTLVVSGEAGGNTCTFTMLLDVNTMTINFGFMFQP